MNEHVFLAALHETPGDEVTWLALADWLEEVGQSERAELVRLMRRLRTMPAMKRSKQRATVEDRTIELLAAGVRPAVPEVTNSIGMRLALIEPGRFRMGSPAEEQDRGQAETAHEVEIKRPFYLGVFLVTQAHYLAVMDECVSSFRAGERNGSRVSGLNTDDFPLEAVSWYQAVEFCTRLSKRREEKRARRVYHLPTEAEWEYACRAGTLTPFHLGKELSGELANINGNHPWRETRKVGTYLARPCPVGSHRPNAWGLYDMHGNVMEWCSDWYAADYYKNSPERDPPGPESGEQRVTRGGCWFFGGGANRSAFRNHFNVDAQDSCVGFRVAMTVASPS